MRKKIIIAISVIFVILVFGISYFVKNSAAATLVDLGLKEFDGPQIAYDSTAVYCKGNITGHNIKQNLE